MLGIEALSAALLIGCPLICNGQKVWHYGPGACPRRAGQALNPDNVGEDSHIVLVSEVPARTGVLRNGPVEAEPRRVSRRPGKSIENSRPGAGWKGSLLVCKITPEKKML